MCVCVSLDLNNVSVQGTVKRHQVTGFMFHFPEGFSLVKPRSKVIEDRAKVGFTVGGTLPLVSEDRHFHRL